MAKNRLTKVDDCFYLDESGRIYFCVSDFLKANDLPNHWSLRLIVVDEVLEIFPEVLILGD
jgi:hypothetical protein